MAQRTREIGGVEVSNERHTQCTDEKLSAQKFIDVI